MRDVSTRGGMVQLQSSIRLIPGGGRKCLGGADGREEVKGHHFEVLLTLAFSTGLSPLWPCK